MLLHGPSVADVWPWCCCVSHSHCRPVQTVCSGVALQPPASAAVSVSHSSSAALQASYVLHHLEIPSLPSPPGYLTLLSSSILNYLPINTLQFNSFRLCRDWDWWEDWFDPLLKDSVCTLSSTLQRAETGTEPHSDEAALNNEKELIYTCNKYINL